MDGKFNCRAIFVAGVHKMAPPSSITYSIVVTRESVRLEFLISSLNDLDIFSCNICNAYLNSPCQVKLCSKTES